MAALNDRICQNRVAIASVIEVAGIYGKQLENNGILDIKEFLVIKFFLDIKILLKCLQ